MQIAVTSSYVRANSFSYSQRHHEEITRKRRYRDIIAKVKGHLVLDVLENTLTQAHVFVLEPSTSTSIEGNEQAHVQIQAQRQVHSRSMSTTDYLAYLRVRNLVFADALRKYSIPVFRQLRWYSFLNRRRAEDKMIQNYVDHFAVRNEYGKTVRDEQGRTRSSEKKLFLGD